MLIAGKVKDLSVDDPFFDSFKKDYPEFKNWFSKIGDRIAYYNLDNNKLTCLLILKLEYYSEPYQEMSIKFNPAIRLKICSLKLKLNDLDTINELKDIIYREASKNSVDEIYITTIHEDIKKLVESWNFNYTCNSNNELVFIKNWRNNSLN